MSRFFIIFIIIFILFYFLLSRFGNVFYFGISAILNLFGRIGCFGLVRRCLWIVWLFGLFFLLFVRKKFLLSLVVKVIRETLFLFQSNLMMHMKNKTPVLGNDIIPFFAGVKLKRW